VGEDLRRLISEADWKAAAQIVHKIKSSAGSIGAAGVQATAADLQKFLQEADVPGIEQTHERFQAALSELLQVISAYLE